MTRPKKRPASKAILRMEKIDIDLERAVTVA
jgi:hypothetical protein